MKADSKSYDIVIEPALDDALRLLKSTQHADILERLCLAAEEAAAPRRTRVGVDHIAGMHRGLHSAQVGGQNIVYRVDHVLHLVTLMKTRARPSHPSPVDVSRWENEGGNA